MANLTYKISLFIVILMVSVDLSTTRLSTLLVLGAAILLVCLYEITFKNRHPQQKNQL